MEQEVQSGIVWQLQTAPVIAGLVIEGQLELPRGEGTTCQAWQYVRAGVRINDVQSSQTSSPSREAIGSSDNTFRTQASNISGRLSEEKSSGLLRETSGKLPNRPRFIPLLCIVQSHLRFLSAHFFPIAYRFVQSFASFSYPSLSCLN